MRTHKEALYIRQPGDKFRPLRIHRPTLRKVAARLRRCKAKIAELRKIEAAPVNPLLESFSRADVAKQLTGWRARQKSIQAYLDSLHGTPKIQPTFTQRLKSLFRIGRNKTALA